MRETVKAGFRMSRTIRLRQAVTISAAVLLLFLFVFAPASATPPSAMSLSYDQQVSLLSVTMTHATTNPAVHYIKEVKLTVNGLVANDSSYTSQPADTFTYTFPLGLHPGDIVEATATCSLAGSASRTFILPGPTATRLPGLTDEPVEPSPTPRAAAATFVPVAGILATVLLRRG